MSLTGINSLTIVGNLAADAEIKEVKINGGKEITRVAEATLYARRRRNRDESFRLDISIWENSDAWRSVQYLKQGSLICVFGHMEPSPYITSNTNEPRAGLQIDPVNRIELISVKGDDDGRNGQGQSDQSQPQKQPTDDRSAAESK